MVSTWGDADAQEFLEDLLGFSCGSSLPTGVVPTPAMEDHVYINVHAGIMVDRMYIHAFACRIKMQWHVQTTCWDST
jgi:hypothetical protein